MSDSARLLEHLQALRRHVLGVLDGLDEEQLLRPVLPSGWSCAGLVRHLALDDEEFWFAAVVAGEADAIAACTSRGPTDAWTIPAGVSGASVLDGYRAFAERTDAIVLARPLDAPLAWWPDFLGEQQWLGDLQDVLMHHITETATHCGHLDAARELIDGHQHLVL